MQDFQYPFSIFDLMSYSSSWALTVLQNKFHERCMLAKHEDCIKMLQKKF